MNVAGARVLATVQTYNPASMSLGDKLQWPPGRVLLRPGDSGGPDPRVAEECLAARAAPGSISTAARPRPQRGGRGPRASARWKNGGWCASPARGPLRRSTPSPSGGARPLLADWAISTRWRRSAGRRGALRRGPGLSASARRRDTRSLRRPRRARDELRFARRRRLPRSRGCSTGTPRGGGSSRATRTVVRRHLAQARPGLVAARAARLDPGLCPSGGMLERFCVGQRGGQRAFYERRCAP
jgi:hypothetical protein